jgi:cytochrome c oxidase subunit 4
MPAHSTQRTTYLIVYVILMALLALTAAIARLPTGAWSLPAALAIATAKLLLIFSCFMHLRIHRGLTRIFAAAGFFWFGLLIVLAFSDYLTRAWLF